MELGQIKRIADAVLYEGYMLYPYRASSVKNRQRFNWGTLAPPACTAIAGGSETSEMRAEFIAVVESEAAVLDVKLRFLQLVEREIRNEHGEIVEGLDVDRQLYLPWQEAIEQEFDIRGIHLKDGVRREGLEFAEALHEEPIRNESDEIAGAVIRTRKRVTGSLDISATGLDLSSGQRIFVITVWVANTTPMDGDENADRDKALLSSLVSTHMIFSIEGGSFVSLLDPPEELRQAAASCSNNGCFPVLVGERDSKCLLASPIILYDYPEVAAESPGDLYDSTEIDEILTLRINTLTDAEKAEAMAVDGRARKLLERSHDLSPESFMQMHGVLRKE